MLACNNINESRYPLCVSSKEIHAWIIINNNIRFYTGGDYFASGVCMCYSNWSSVNDCVFLILSLYTHTIDIETLLRIYGLMECKLMLLLLLSSLLMFIMFKFSGCMHEFNENPLLVALSMIASSKIPSN